MTDMNMDIKINTSDININRGNKYLTERDIGKFWSMITMNNKNNNTNSDTNNYINKLNLIKLKYSNMKTSIDEFINALIERKTIENDDRNEFIILGMIYLSDIRNIKKILLNNKFKLNKRDIDIILSKRDNDDIHDTAKYISNHKHHNIDIYENNNSNMIFSQINDVFLTDNETESTTSSYSDEYNNISHYPLNDSHSERDDYTDNLNDLLNEDNKLWDNSSESSEDIIDTKDTKDTKSEITVIISEDIKAIQDEYKKNNNVNNAIRISFFKLLIGAFYRLFKSTSEPTYKNIKTIYTLEDVLSLLDKSIINIKNLKIVTDDKLEHLKKIMTIMQNERLRIMKNVEINKNGYIYGKIENELLANQEILDTKSQLGKLGINDNYIGKDEKQLQNKIILLKRKKSSLPFVSFKDRYTRIIINNNDEYNSQSLISNRVFYEDILPLLLRTFSSDPIDEIIYDKIKNGETDIKLLDEYYDKNKKIIRYFCKDVSDSFNDLTIDEKIIIKQSWEIAKEHFIRKIESKIESMDLSQYIPFIDVILDKKYVEYGKIMIATPSFIGPEIWKLLHGIPELMDISDQKDKTKMLKDYKELFMNILNTYPCPHCRLHLNDHVINKTELTRYPLEYIFMSWDVNKNEANFDTKIGNIIDKLDTIDDIRLFIWKFHNAVSVTLTFNTLNENKLYTNEHYWPSIERMDNNYKVEYGNLLEYMEKQRTIFINELNSLQYIAMDDINDLKDRLDRSLKTINNIFNDVKESIIKLDKIIIDSKIIQRTFGI